jgi:predicted nucleic acid-binding Zn ribbon protein
MRPADRARLAAEALAEARADARARGNLPAGLRGQPGSAKTDHAERSGAIPSGHDGTLAGAEAAGRGHSPGGPEAAGRGHSPGGPEAAGRGRSPGGSAPGRGRRHQEDPERLDQAIGGLLDTRGWQQRAAVGSVFGRWAEIVGADLAAHTAPDAFADGELTVTADSTAWATQVRLLAPQLLRRLAAELGDGTVRRVKVRGPAPPRRQGAWRVPGGRGPRGDYG